MSPDVTASEREKTVAEPFYRYADEQGRVHIVDRFEEVPGVYRDRAEVVDLERSTAVLPTARSAASAASAVSEPVRSEAKVTSKPSTDPVSFLRQLHGPSVVTGFGLALAAYATLSLVRRMGPTAVRIALVLAASGTITLAYLGWVRQAAGLSTDRLSTPGQLIDDARAATERMKVRLQERQRILREVEDTSR